MNLTITTTAQSLATLLASVDLSSKTDGSQVNRITLQNNGTSTIWLSTFGAQPTGVGIKIPPNTAVDFSEVDLNDVYLIAEADNSNVGLAVF